MKTVERKDDMSTKGKIRVRIQDDGDILVSCFSERDGLCVDGGAVEFCNPYLGGGKSAHTHAALRELFLAIEADNIGGNRPAHGVNAPRHADGLTDDLVMLVARLSLALQKFAPAHELSENAMDYLRRKGLILSPLRQDCEQ